jgi:hypothetical protein
MPDCVQALITADVKAALRAITTANGYHYDVAAVEEARRFLQIGGRWDFILLLEDEPLMDDWLTIHTLRYAVWFFPAYNDELVGVAATDLDSEIGRHVRNAPADIARALEVDQTRGGRASKTEVVPGEGNCYVDQDTVLFGCWCRADVHTQIDATDPYQLR